MEPRLSLVVIRAKDLTRSRRFYESLGLTFREEQHGSGPMHLACELGTTVFEIYPAKSADTVTSSVRIGFCLPNLDASIELATTCGGQLVSQPTCGPWGRRAVLRDPDDHTVEAIQSFHV